ncbi:MAG: ATP-binding protein [Tabrizicola sp.]|jgi:hypothetical protein|nr:ATP-binding protein [Tabrizicola sp.]
MPDRFATTEDWLAHAARTISRRAAALIAAEEGSGSPFIAANEARSLAERLAQEACLPLPDEDAQNLARLAEPEAISHLPVGRLCVALDLPLGLAPLIAVMLLPEVNAGFAQVFAYLNDDAQRRQLTLSLARRLLGGLPMPSAALLSAEGPLPSTALIDQPDPGRPFDDRSIRLADAVVAWLMGLPPAWDERLTHIMRRVPDAPLSALTCLAFDADPARLSALATYPLALVGPAGSGRLALAAALIRHHHRVPLALDAQGLDGTLLTVAQRDAALRGAQLILLQAQSLPPQLLKVASGGRHPVILLSETRLDTDAPQISMQPPGRSATRQLWRALMPAGLPEADELAATLAHRFRLPVSTVISLARDRQAMASIDAATRACLAQSSSALDSLARRVEARQGWDDLILPDRQTAQLRGLVARATHARQVYESWGFGHKLSPDRGLTALFSGPSGAGKTLSASIIAQALGLPLYRVDLSSTVSKYIGETEKHLEQIFTAAESGNACLFFDECDALFGKRSEVSDAHDRYANIETSYLLQRLESHRGIVILATNHPQNIDDAFTRRIDVTIAFPLPDAETRQRLWQALLPPEAEAKIDAETLGRQFDLSGGAIRNCLVTAAFLAAEEGVALQTDHCLRAVAQEYEKSGRPLTRTEFGEAFTTLRLRRGR